MNKIPIKHTRPNNSKPDANTPPDELSDEQVNSILKFYGFLFVWFWLWLGGAELFETDALVYVALAPLPLFLVLGGCWMAFEFIHGLLMSRRWQSRSRVYSQQQKYAQSPKRPTPDTYKKKSVFSRSAGPRYTVKPPPRPHQLIQVKETE